MLVKSILFFLSLLSLLHHELIAAEPTSLHGTVIDSTTREPIAYANVYLDNTSIGTVTDLDGYFSLSRIPPNTYDLIIQYIGYQSERGTIHLSPDSSLFIEVTLTAEPIQADTVIVTAEHLHSSTINVGRVMISGAEMRTAPSIGEPDLFRVMEMHPGITTTNDFNLGLYVRGGNRDQNLILLDGMPIYNPYHLIGLFSTFDSDAIQWTNVYKSGIDPAYGNRLSSVIDINMRDGSSENHSLFTNVSLLSSKFRAEGPHPWGSYMLTLRRTYADLIINGLRSAGLLPEEVKLPYHFVDGMGKIVIKPTNRQRLELTAYFGSDIYDLGKLNDDTTSNEYIWANSATGLSYVRFVSPSLSLHAGSAWSSFTARWLPPDSTRNEQIDNEISGWRFYSFLKWNRPELGTVELGGELQFLEHHLQTVGLSYQPLIVSQSESNEHSLFALLSRSIGLKPRLQTGVRITNFTFQDTVVFSPQASASFRLTDGVEMNIHWGRYHQGLMTIGTEEVLLTMFDAWVTVPKDLPVMAADHSVFSLNWYLQRGIELSSALYYKKFLNLIEYNTQKYLPSDPDFVQGTGVASGVELMVKKRTGRFQGWLAYTYSDAWKSVKGITYTPKYNKTHDLNVVLRYELTSKWSVGARFVYQTGTPFSRVIGYYRQHFTDTLLPSNHIEVPVYSARNAYRLPPYHRLDLSFIRPVSLLGKELEMYVDLINVYGRLNVLSYSKRNDTWIQMPPIVTFGIRGKLW